MASERHTGFFAGRREALKRAVAGLSLLLPACGRNEPAPAPAPPTGDFTEGALRLDLRQRIGGGAEDFELERLRFEPVWPGRRDGLADGPDWGDYRLSVYSGRGEPPLFRQGFDTDLATEARAATTRVSMRLPVPRRPAQAAIEKRLGDSAFRTVATFEIGPGAQTIDRSPVATPARVETVHGGGEPAAQVDLAILGDGYGASEYPKFAADARRAAEYLFSVEPFRTRSRDFTVRAVFSPSAESGVTDPYLGRSRRTALGCAYGSGAAERTLSVGDPGALREAAAAVPYDCLLVLANARRYGGSAHFGGPAVVAMDSAAAKYLVVHELAHAIAGLAEEYYVAAGSGPAYGGNVEPWQPNVTLSPRRAKWRALLDEPPRATPWRKAEYDRRFAGYVRRYDSLRQAGAPEEAIEKLMTEERAWQGALLGTHARARRAGCFEGANGYARGMFRSGLDCIMFSLQAEYFCPACTAALDLAIDRQCS